MPVAECGWDEIPGEPVTGQLSGGRESAWLLEQVRRAGTTARSFSQRSPA